MEVGSRDGVEEEEEDWVGSDSGGSVGGEEEATKCRMASWKASMTFSIGKINNQSLIVLQLYFQK